VRKEWGEGNVQEKLYTQVHGLSYGWGLRLDSAPNLVEVTVIRG
jgi:hypothetical protein